MANSLIDRIYEAAAAPDHWPDVLDAVAACAGALGGVLLVLAPAGLPRWVASRSVAGSVSGIVGAEAWRSGCGAALRRSAVRASLARDGGRMSAEAPGLVRGADGLVWGVGAAVGLPNGETAVVALARDETEPSARPPRAPRRDPDADGGPAPAPCAAPRLNALRPHLARSCQLGARLGRERAVATATALDLIGFPAAVLTASGRTLGVNPRLQAAPGVLLSGAHDGVAFRDLLANKRVGDAIRAASAAGGDGRTRSIPVRASAEHGAFIAHVVPVRGPSGDVFNAAAALLVVTPVCPPNAPDDHLLHALFDLTPAEARLLQALAGGLRLQSYADGAGVRASTARTQLASIFSKTGTSRQAELLGIVASISVLAARSPQAPSLYAPALHPEGAYC